MSTLDESCPFYQNLPKVIHVANQGFGLSGKIFPYNEASRTSKITEKTWPPMVLEHIS